MSWKRPTNSSTLVTVKVAASSSVSSIEVGGASANSSTIAHEHPVSFQPRPAGFEYAGNGNIYGRSENRVINLHARYVLPRRVGVIGVHVCQW